MVKPQFTGLTRTVQSTGKVLLVNGRLAVLRLFDAMLALLASLLLCLLPGSSALAGPIALNDILDIDPLGYECIPSKFFEDGEDGSAAVAFSLSGKTRLPRTCLPDPCARSLSPQELSSLTGTEPILAKFSNEWDDYYSRYADHCVREVTVSRPRTSGDFWKPIISRATTTQRVGLPTSSRVVPFVPGIGGSSTPTLLPSLISFSTPEGGIAGPSPVPVPASGLMLGTLLAGAVWTARRRRKQQGR
jgi:hypothetical protein